MERMNGGYIMLDMTTAEAERVQAAYESGKMVIMFDGDSVQPATVTKSGSTYTVTGIKTAYTVTADSKTKTNAAYELHTALNALETRVAALENAAAAAVSTRSKK